MPENQLEKREGKITSAGQEVSLASSVQGMEISEKDISIYTMPKEFLKGMAPVKKARSVGFFILLGGVILFCLACIFVYFYIFKKTDSQFFQWLKLGNSLPATQEQGNQPVSSPEEKPAETGLEKKATVTSEILTDKSLGKVGSDSLSATATEETDIGQKEDLATGTTTIVVGEFNSSTTTKLLEVSTGQDSDQDGLFDGEEALFGTDVFSRDSDRDGYDDLTEVLALYNPAGSGRLMANANIEKYINNQFNYYLYYINSWQVERAGGDESIIFKTQDQQFIQVIVVEKTKQNESLADWYKANAGVNYLSPSQIVYKKGWEGISSEDNLNVYLTKPDIGYLIILSYNLGPRNILDYKNIFAMFINSLEIIN